jgi:RNA polymerase-binding protein DksA
MDAKKTRAKLEQLKQEIEERLAGLDRELHLRDEPLSADSQEQAVELEGREMLEELDDRSAEELRLVEHALARLESGAYGVCESCGKAVGAARLDALPFATHCVACASSAEKDSGR